jgi:hypothetical protein
MNWNISFAIFVALLTVTGSTLLGQPREISKSEYYAASQAAYAKLEKASYRVKWTRDLRRADIATEQGALISSITEFTPSGRQRIVTTWQTANGTRKEETIKAGDKEFKKTDDGPWKDLSDNQPDRFSIYGDPGKKTEETATYRHLGSDRVRDLEVELFEEIVYAEYSFGNKTTGFSNLNRLWIAKDGRLLKSEWKHSGSNGVVTSHSVSEYEYDPNIRIGLPHVKVK